jgi:hypothetical protein
MAVSREKIREAIEFSRSIPMYDRRTGKRILERDEWEQLPRWRRWRDIFCGWDPPQEYRFHWERED